MSLEALAVGLITGLVTGVSSTVLTGRVMLAVHEERFKNLLDRLERLEGRLETFEKTLLSFPR